MSLTSSLSSAKTSLFVTGEQTSVVSRNISNADTKLYSRKSAELVSIPGTGVSIASVRRAEEPALFRSLLASTSDANANKAILDSVDELNATVNDVELDASPAALLSKLRDAIQTFSAQPQSKLAAEAAVRAAGNMATGLNNAAEIVQTVRRDADLGIEAAVSSINERLAEFQAVNDQIVLGTRSNADVTDLLDARDRILSELSVNIGIRTLSRPGNDMAVYTDSGAPLFDRVARPVTFDRSAMIASGQPGNAVYIDGIPVSGTGAPMPLQSGRLVGLLQVRDQISVDYERQLDEVARTLIDVFKESDLSGALPDAPGLFTYPGAPTMPASATLVDGLASTISLNPNANPDVGGVATRLRDGGIADPSISNYVYNTTGAASYTDRLDSLLTRLDQPQSYDTTAKLASSGTLADYSSSSVAWLQEVRKNADSQYQYSDTLNKRAAESHSKATGVNLDEEMSNLLELERSYQTSSKIISTVDAMFTALISALR